uniref:C-type lectin domain-containing protein n=1 Tax=Sinocyclocheilus grahami TaxID=75366 RepID=A0A672P7J1_SINGR
KKNISCKTGFLSVILCDSHDYVLVQERTFWKEARDFCRKHYIDLATVQTDEEWIELNKIRAKYGSKTWIGLYDDVNSWRWSFLNECPTYARWDTNQPDNYGGDQDCVMLHSNGYWHDEDCDLKCFFFVCKIPCKYFYFRECCNCFWVLILNQPKLHQPEKRWISTEYN